MLDLMLFEYERSLSIYQRRWQLSGHPITGRCVKDLSLEFFYPILFKYESITKGVATQLPPITGRYVKDLSPEKVSPHIVLV